MDQKLIPFAVLTALCAVSCSNEVVLEQNDDPKGNAIAFSTKVGHSSRAAETTIENLGDFDVIAKSVYNDGSLYNAYLIGSDAGGEKAKRDGNTSTWNLDHNVYLPNSVRNVAFWAFTDQQVGDTDSKVLSSGTVSFDSHNGPKISGYTSATADLENEELSTWADGYAQHDLVTAFAQAKNDGVISNVIKLDFAHLLSQVKLNASQLGKAQNDHRVVKVKGAWFVNVRQKATLSAGYAYESGTDKISDKPSWGAWENPACFGTYYKDNIDLSSATTEKGEDLLKTPLMLIPQDENLAAWDAKTENTTDTYIMLLCRVELKHPGDTHGAGTASGDDIYAAEGYHYHQQFPVNAEGKYNANEYGLTCIPVKIDWKSGYRYTYNLDICGAASGAGVYPPIAPEDAQKLIPAGDADIVLNTTRPSGKNIGDPVLDEPIKFNVSVSAWKEDSEWTNGSLSDSDSSKN